MTKIVLVLLVQMMGAQTPLMDRTVMPDLDTCLAQAQTMMKNPPKADGVVGYMAGCMVTVVTGKDT